MNVGVMKDYKLRDLRASQDIKTCLLLNRGYKSGLLKIWSVSPFFFNRSGLLLNSVGLLTFRKHVLATLAAESLPEPAAEPSVTRQAEI